MMGVTAVVRKAKADPVEVKKKTAKVKAAAPTAAKPVKEKKPIKDGPGGRARSGLTTGLGIAAFQDQLMAKNFKAKLTDEELAAAMRAEFPEAVPYTTAHVAGIRSMWNNGKRTSQHGVKPDVALTGFNAEGQPITGRGNLIEKPKKVKDEAAPKKAKLKSKA
ncbi:MAG: hypothetical protein E6R03_00155 [Hyphomicrobiaceae bacterium]|nr:MAG: hypothetical protein E6R03_00155 [Hyphomicrobiaceae bacterium]